MADILDGDYRVVDEALQIALAPSVSAEARAELFRILLGLRDNRISLEDAERQIAKTEPRLKGIFRSISDWPAEAKATFIGSVLMAIATVAVAGATVAAPFLAPAPVIQVVEQSAWRQDLARTTSLSPVTRKPSPNAKQHERHGPNGHARTKTSPKHNAR